LHTINPENKYSHLGMLFFKVPEAVIRSRKRLFTRGKMASECAFEMNGVEVSPEIFVQSKTLSVGTATNIAFESTLVCSGVLSTR
jgi:hypothetical protein